MTGLPTITRGSTVMPSAISVAIVALPLATRPGALSHLTSDAQLAPEPLGLDRSTRLPAFSSSSPELRLGPVGRGRPELAASPLDVGELLGHLAISDPEQVDPANVSGLPLSIDPLVAPADDAAIPSGEQILG